ncbi:hypothetical protein V1477_014807 [Vespula maculifrons]|uniref:Uncharacterized protein n=1 Tax=Vespula maculifrons TaxID=7453 RepID=A0ABD2BII0_VESMC
MALSNVFKRVGRKFISDRRYYECLAATFSNRYYIAAGCCKTKTLNFAIKAVHNRFESIAVQLQTICMIVKLDKAKEFLVLFSRRLNFVFQVVYTYTQAILGPVSDDSLHADEAKAPPLTRLYSDTHDPEDTRMQRAKSVTYAVASTCYLTHCILLRVLSRTLTVTRKDAFRVALRNGVHHLVNDTIPTSNQDILSLQLTRRNKIESSR